jgi:octaprenyl-diphosphate synthase
MKIRIEDIKQPVAEELKRFEDHFRHSMKSNVALLDRIIYYIVRRKGKQMRPMFVFLSARIFGPCNPSTFNAASMIELLHTATLVHDDVVDDSHMRRGFFSINALWKNKIAVLVGDFLLSRGLLLAVEQKEFQLLEIMSTAVKQMSEGELLQIEKARKLDIDESIYYSIIEQKTASLIAASCVAGAASTTQDESHLNQMHLLGTKIGMAFQIKDDLFDYGQEDVGKPLGIDIKERKMTLPLIYALSQSTDKEKKYIVNLVRNKNHEKKSVKEVIHFVRAKGGLEYAHKKMNEYKEEAESILSSLPQNAANDAVSQLIRYVIERKK